MFQQIYAGCDRTGWACLSIAIIMGCTERLAACLPRRELSPRSWLCMPHATFAEAERYCGEAEQAWFAIETAIKLEAHRQPWNRPRASRESEHQLQAFRTYNQNASDCEEVFTRKNSNSAQVLLHS